MAIDYNIKAIPTVYNEIRYRSRLEARWAAMFDGLGFVHTYEPFDLGTWSPDFMIGQKGDSSSVALVEIKPITECDEETLDRMERATRASHMFDEVSSFVGVILLGVSPYYTNMIKPVGAGWCRLGCTDKTNRVDFGWMPTVDKPGFVPDFVRLDQDGGFSLLSGHGGGREDVPAQFYPNYVMSLWAKATNTVQWLPRR